MLVLVLMIKLSISKSSLSSFLYSRQILASGAFLILLIYKLILILILEQMCSECCYLKFLYDDRLEKHGKWSVDGKEERIQIDSDKLSHHEFFF